MGKAALTSHVNSQKHQLKSSSLQVDEAASSSPSSLSLPSTSNSGTIAESEKHEINVIKAEIIWSLMTAEHDLPFLISDHVSKAFSIMFPESPTAVKLKLLTQLLMVYHMNFSKD